MIHKILVSLLAPALVSCAPLTGTSCMAGDSISAELLVLSVADRIAKQSSYLKNQDGIVYRSGRQLISANHLWCFVYIDKNLATANIVLSLSNDTSVVIYYKKFRGGDQKLHIAYR
jgi:hypothetical protein